MENDPTVPVPLSGLFAIYKSTYLEPMDNVTHYVEQLIGQLGYGVCNGFLVKDGAYFNETTGVINGAVNLGDVIWQKGKPLVRATQEMVHG